MKEVIAIHEDNHGLIGIAEDYKSAISFLKYQKWLTRTTDFYDEDLDDYYPIVEVLGAKWDEIILEYGIDEFNTNFEGIFYLDEVEVYKAE